MFFFLKYKQNAKMLLFLTQILLVGSFPIAAKRLWRNQATILDTEIFDITSGVILAIDDEGHMCKIRYKRPHREVDVFLGLFSNEYKDIENAKNCVKAHAMVWFTPFTHDKFKIFFKSLVYVWFKIVTQLLMPLRII